MPLIDVVLGPPEPTTIYLDFPRFDGGDISSDGGALLLRRVEELTGIIRHFATCFTDHRNPDLIEHLLEHLIAQRVYGLALGYEDLNDHDDLRRDPLLATVVGKDDPTGQSRERERDQGKALAGKSTLNRIELTPVGADEEDRYKKITCHIHAVDQLFVALFLQAHQQPPEQIVLDLDATDDPIHGDQLGGFFHGYYKHYCFLPLYIFCGSHLLCAKLRPADIDASAGALKQLQRIIGQIRLAWPQVKILVRGDSSSKRPSNRPACSRTSAIRLGRAGAAYGEWWPRLSISKRAPTLGSSSPRSPPRCVLPRPCMKTTTVLAARWRTGSRSNNCTCSLTEPVLTPCGLIRFACSSRRWPTRCWTRYDGWDFPEPKWLGRNARRSG